MLVFCHYLCQLNCLITIYSPYNYMLHWYEELTWGSIWHFCHVQIYWNIYFKIYLQCFIKSNVVFSIHWVMCLFIFLIILVFHTLFKNIWSYIIKYYLVHKAYKIYHIYNCFVKYGQSINIYYQCIIKMYIHCLFLWYSSNEMTIYWYQSFHI